MSVVLSTLTLPMGSECLLDISAHLDCAFLDREFEIACYELIHRVYLYVGGVFFTAGSILFQEQTVCGMWMDTTS